MDGSIERVTESLAPRPVAARRERRRREDEPEFQLPTATQGSESSATVPSPEPEARPIAAPEEGEPGTRLDVRG